VKNNCYVFFHYVIVSVSCYLLPLTSKYRWQHPVLRHCLLCLNIKGSCAEEAITKSSTRSTSQSVSQVRVTLRLTVGRSVSQSVLKSVTLRLTVGQSASHSFSQSVSQSVCLGIESLWDSWPYFGYS